MTAPAGITDVEDALFIEYLPLAKTIAESVWRRLPHPTTLDELTQAAAAGLGYAVREFGPLKKISLVCYVKFRVRGAILDHVNNLSQQGRGERETSAPRRKEPNRLETTHEAVSVKA
jgi:DNA-directed RNA polymerase specialized sigma subunit